MCIQSTIVCPPSRLNTADFPKNYSFILFSTLGRGLVALWSKYRTCISCILWIYHNWSLMEMHPSMMLPCTSYCGVLNTPTIIIILSIHLDEEDIDENVRIL